MLSWPVFSNEPSWSGTVGLFILNFGVLDLRVSEVLRDRIELEEFERLRRKGFKERVDRVVAELQMAAEVVAEIERSRGLRNHIAHAYLNLNGATGEQTLVVPQDADAGDDMRHLTFDELIAANKAVTDLIEVLS